MLAPVGNPLRHSVWRLLPGGVFLLLAASFTWLWLQGRERGVRALERETRQFAEQTALRLEDTDDYLHAVARQVKVGWSEGASTLLHFTSLAEDLLDYYPAALACRWISPGQETVRFIPRPSDDLLPTWRNEREDSDGALQAMIHASLQEARRTGRAAYSPPLGRTGGPGYVEVYFPLGDDAHDGFVGLYYSLDAITGGFSETIQTRFDYTLLCSQGGDSGPAWWFGSQGPGRGKLARRPHQASHAIRMAPHIWQAVLSPKPGQLIESTTLAENLLFGGGLLLAALLAWILQRSLRSAEDLAVSEKRYRRIVTDLPDFLCRYRPDGTITFTNEAFASRLGTTTDDLLGRNLFALYPEELDERDAFDERLSRGEERIVQRYLPPREGHQGRWERWHERGIQDSAGTLVEIQAVGYDITPVREAEERLRQSQERYQALVEAGPDGLLIHRDGAIVYANQALAQQIARQSALQLIGTPVAELFPPSDYREFSRLVEASLASGRAQRCDDIRILHREGRRIDVEIILSRIVFDGQPCVQTVVRDATERKQAERALRESENRFRTIIGSIGDAILLHDRTGAIIEANGRAGELFGLERDLLEHQDLAALMAYPTAAAVGSLREHFAVARKTQEPQLFQFEARRGPEERWWAEVHLRPVVLEGRNLLLSVIRDISSRKQDQEDLRAARNRLDCLLSTGPTIIYSRSVGPDSRLTFVSRSSSRLVGLRAEALIEDSQLWRAAIHEGDRLRFDATLSEAELRGTRFSCAYRLTTASGEQIWIQDDALLQRDAEGRPQEWVGCWRDITASKRTEQSRDLMIRELDHRVKNVLAVVLSLLEQTLRDLSPSDSFEQVFRGRIKALAHAHAALAKGEWEEVELADLAGRVLGTLVPPGQLSLVGPRWTLAARMASPLGLVLYELAINARKYGALLSPEGRIDLTWRVAGEHLSIVWRELVPQSAPSETSEVDEGFGWRLVRGLVEHELGGRITSRMGPGGLEITILLDQVEASPSPTDGEDVAQDAGRGGDARSGALQ